MPQQTFYNLSAERQHEILEVALREFTMNSYNNASLSMIIMELGIAKGSFYRYFTSKKCLFDHLVEYVTKKKVDFINESEVTIANDFFEELISHTKSKIKS